jgi:zinc protease
MTKRLCCTPSAVLALVLLLSPATPHAGVLDATRITLKNGMRIVLAPDSLATAVDAALWFPSGPRHEQPSQAGMALLAARLGFRNGSAEPLAPLQAEGGIGNLLAVPDLTSFSATVPVEGLAAALDFLAVRLRGGPIAPADLASERAAIRAERQRTDRTPVALALARLWEATWPGHPYAKAGAAPSVGPETLTPADIMAWRKARFAPATAVLTVAGAFNADSVLIAIRSRFEPLAAGSIPAERALAAPRAPVRATAAVPAGLAGSGCGRP